MSICSLSYTYLDVVMPCENLMPITFLVPKSHLSWKGCRTPILSKPWVVDPKNERCDPSKCPNMGGFIETQIPWIGLSEMTYSKHSVAFSQ